MLESFVGFPSGTSPAMRVLFARGRAFPQFMKVAFLANAVTHVVGLPPTRGIVVVEAGALLNSSGSTVLSQTNLIARIGGVTVGTATFVTDQLDNDGITNRSIAANTPGFYKLIMWPTTDQRLSVIGLTYGGVKIYSVTSGLFDTTSLNVGITTTANVGDAAIELLITQSGVSSGAFTLDWLRVFEALEADRLPT